MAFFGNLEGTLQTIFSLAKGSNKVSLRSNAGILQGQNNGGAWTDLIGGESVEIKTASFSAVNKKIYVVTSLTPITATLPAPVLNAKITIKKLNAGDITVAQNASEPIDGAPASFIISSEKQSATFVSDGSEWFII